MQPDWPAEIYKELVSAGVRVVGYVPDAGHKRLIELCHEDRNMRAVPLSTEEEGIGLVAGAWLGGEKSVLLMQSSGVGNIINVLGMVQVCRFPLAILVTKNALMERLLLPLFDIAQSVPVLAFFPIVIAFFLRFGFSNGAATFIIFITMLWTMVFSLVGGLKTIPSDIKEAAQVFGIKGSAFTRKILLPGVVPYLVTGSLLTWAQGWNIVIVAEVLRTYIPGGTTANDLFGIGSILVDASANAENGMFVAALLAMILLIAFLNFFVWQKLLRYAERYKFE